ncbi:MAG: RsmB/NOP family class I SAM-dependent RNA methyltransferase [Pseudomonadota bacterium]
MVQAKSKVAGLGARRAALKMLDAVLRRGETLEQCAPGILRDLRAPADQALARAIASETMRWLVDIDALIDSATRQRLPDDAKARNVLRLMLAQALRLGTLPHAVIATGLPLLAGGPRRLAHGVFSALIRRGADLPEYPALPASVTERWGERASAIARGLAHPPELDLALRDRGETAHWQAKLSGVSLASGHVRVPRGIPVEQLTGYAEGAWWVQDLAAQLPARLIGKGVGRHALDLCAAPGGKTLGLAAAGWKVTALDISKRRLDVLKANLKRTGLKASPVRADALTWEPKHAFDAILLDAPCSATGTCRRHPDVLHRVGAREITELAELQRALVARAIDWLKPGGLLVYAVCSLEHEEGEAQAAWIDAALELEPQPITNEDLPTGIAPTPQGWVRTQPGQLSELGGLDGFFIARWRRR